MEDIKKDKFKAVWLSHSSISDFIKCPRLYFLRNIYKDPRTGHKVTVMIPPLALGQIVHDVVESLSELPVEERFAISPIQKFEVAWKKVSGEKGGFIDNLQEQEFKERGTSMLQNIIDNPGAVKKKALKLRSDNGLPHYWFSEDDNIILCGKIDWIEYLEDTDSIHIIDFKTGKYDEDETSLQLPIYLLLANNLQKRKVQKASYWYLDRDKKPKGKTLPDLDESFAKVEKIAQRIKLARQIELMKCPTNGCRHCFPLERVLKGEGKKVAVSNYNQDIYILQS